MRVKKQILSLGALLLPLIFKPAMAHAEPSNWQPRFRRAECIVLIRQPGGLSESQITQILRSTGPWLNANAPPTVRLSWVAHTDGRVFFMYTDWCDKKRELTLGMISAIAAKYPDIRLELVSEDVLPGSDTINSYGGAWIDGAAPRP